MACSRRTPQWISVAVVVVTSVFMMVYISFSMLEFPPNILYQGEFNVSTKEPLILGCESPSLPRGSVHIVVASYKYNEQDAGIEFDGNNYLFDLRLSNADIFWYRRVQPQHVLRQVNGPCGMVLQERILLPNYGREGTAFIDHVLEVYDHPPKTLIFLHGHGAVGWHTSCESVFARSTYVYRDYARKSHATTSQSGTLHFTGNNSTVQNHMMTLTSSIHGTSDFDAFKWYGINVPTAPRVPPEVLAADEIGRAQQSPCWLFKQRWNQTLSRLPSPPFMSCCASFIVQGVRIRRFPRSFYQDLQSVLTDESQPDQGRECFEYVVYAWFGDEADQFTEQEMQTFYDEADGLVHGRNRSSTAVEPDHGIVNRMERCKASSVGAAESYEKKQKWKNQWRRFDGQQQPPGTKANFSL